MLDFNSAIEIIKEDNNVNCVWYGFPYLDEFAFMVSPNTDYIAGDTEACFILINRNTKEISFPDDVIYTTPFMNAFKRKSFVDITEEQFNIL